MFNWISADEHRPEHKQRVIYYYDMIGTRRGFYYVGKEDCECGFGGSGQGHIHYAGVYWMADVGQDISELEVPGETP